MSHTIPPARVRAKVVRRPDHVDGNYHHEIHLKSLVGLDMQDSILHHDPRPGGSKMVLVPAMRAIMEMMEANDHMGVTYWQRVWRNQTASGTDLSDHHNYFAIPASACEVTQPIPLLP